MFGIWETNMRKQIVWCAVTSVLLALPVGASAQAASWQEVQVADIESMRDKFIQLARAFDESQYDWRPMAGVRSVQAVLGLAVAEAHMFPTGWGYDPPAIAADGFGPEMERAASLDKAALLDELETSFDFLVAVVRDMPESKRVSDGSYFGREMPVHARIATAMADMHEHLGQLIAYARANEVVPPWSQPVQ
jgi:hypothetical protein